jgi:hypothetical protein
MMIGMRYNVNTLSYQLKLRAPETTCSRFTKKNPNGKRKSACYKLHLTTNREVSTLPPHPLPTRTNRAHYLPQQPWPSSAPLQDH